MSRLNETAAALSIISLLISLMFFVTHNMTDAIYVLGIAILEKAMEGLPQPERVILEGRYINSNREPWTHIAELIGYDERYCYKLHNKGLRHIAINLFGIEDVLKAENDKRDKRSIREIGQY